MPEETKGRNSARWVKIISALLLVFGVVVGVSGSATNNGIAGAIGGIMFFVGFFGFIVGRFME